jgi:nucleolar complex protein 2
MADCVVEVLGVDLSAAYQQAFAALRALAMQLRDALSMKSKDAYLQVYCWQTVHSLDLWERVVSAYGAPSGGGRGGGGDGALQPLVYPLTQLLLGAARLVPTSRYFPLRLHLAQTLNRLSHSSGTFVPVAPLLVEVLQFSELSQRPSGGQGHAHDMDGILKVSKSALKTVGFQEQCVGRAVQLLAEHLGQWATHVAFPELAHPTALQLKRFLKLSPVEKFRRQVKQLLEAIDANSEFIMRRRHGVEFSPKDLAEVKRFQADPALVKASPLLKYVRAVAQQAKQAHVAKAIDTVDFKLNPESREESDSEQEGGGVEAGMDLLPQAPAAKSKKQKPESGKKKKKRSVEEADLEGQEDVVEDLVLSSDEEDGAGTLAEPVSDPHEEGDEEKRPPPQSSGRKNKKKARRQ